MTKSLSMSRSVSNGVGASDFIHVDDLEVRGSAPSNRMPSLALLLSSVVSRDSPCASPRCLQAALVEVLCSAPQKSTHDGAQKSSLSSALVTDGF